MKPTRRSFLKMGSAVAVGGLARSASAATSAPSEASEPGRVVSSFDPWVEIHEQNLHHNVSEIARRVENRPILAVIKNNGYGMGVANVAGSLDDNGSLYGFAVVKLQEAVALRDAGIRKPILLMGPFDEHNLEEMIERDIMPMVYTPIGDVLDRMAAKFHRPIPLHICIDTGMGRVGIPYRDAPDLVRELAGRSSVRVEGTMMTFTEDPEFDEEQKRRFKSLCDGLLSEGVPLGKLHSVSSFGLFQHPDAFLDMVRPGMAIYGAYSEPVFRSLNILELRPALSLKARVIYVKQLQRGDSAGYDRAYVAKEPVWIATVPVGHTDGLPRVAAKKAKVRIGSKLYPIVASVSASHCILELGSEKTVSVGDEVAIFDWQDGSRPEDVSEDCGASVYDLTMHLNPLLPRRLV
jgi:alanine racemase